MIKLRCLVFFYKICLVYIIMISLKVIFLVIENLKFILVMFKFYYIDYGDIYGDLYFGNMMYFYKDIIRKVKEDLDKMVLSYVNLCII